jgi:putative transposase
MVLYRRNVIAGATYFFTVTLRDRRATYLVDYIADLRAAFRVAKQQQSFEIIAIDIMPEHLHALIRMADDDANYAKLWRTVKGNFTQQLLQQGVPLQRNARGEYNLWQRRFWEHTIRDDRDLQAHVDYIHFNPVKHGLVKFVAQWPYSSFHRYVRLGLLPKDWAIEQADGEYGEQGSPYAIRG